jgi:hypothetical protein
MTVADRFSFICPTTQQALHQRTSKSCGTIREVDPPANSHSTGSLLEEWGKRSALSTNVCNTHTGLDSASELRGSITWVN